MDWTNKNVNPSKVVHIGEEVEVMVLDIDEDRRRISLGIKQCKPNPWREFADNYNRGDRVNGQIRSITDFGLFIGLPGGIDGLVHLSDLSWDVPGEEAVRGYQKGQTVEAIVVAIDPERERISLSVKQLAKDPFSTWIAEHPKGTIVQRSGKGRRRQGRDRRPGRRHRGISPCLGAVARSRRGRPHGAQGGRRGRGQVHGGGPQGPHHRALDQGEGSA